MTKNGGGSGGFCGFCELNEVENVKRSCRETRVAMMEFRDNPVLLKLQLDSVPNGKYLLYFSDCCKIGSCGNTHCSYDVENYLQNNN